MDLVALSRLTCLGGVGYPIAAGTTADLTFSEACVAVSPSHGRRFTLLYAEISDLLIGGAGTTVTGGGFIGGGFGVEGALEGMAIAAVLNALTTKSKIHTYLSIITNTGEIHLHYSGMEPGALRVGLSAPFTILRRLSSDWQESRRQSIEIARTMNLHEPGKLDLVKSRLSSPLPHDSATREGICPSCKAVVPLASPECPKCRATFGPGAAWKVQPI